MRINTVKWVSISHCISGVGVGEARMKQVTIKWSCSSSKWSKWWVNGACTLVCLVLTTYRLIASTISQTWWRGCMVIDDLDLGDFKSLSVKRISGCTEHQSCIPEMAAVVLVECTLAHRLWGLRRWSKTVLPEPRMFGQLYLDSAKNQQPSSHMILKDCRSSQADINLKT